MPKDDIAKYAKLLPYSPIESGILEEDCLKTISELCHKLDVPRCYDEKESAASVDIVFQNSVDNADGKAKEAWKRLKQWTIDCIRATGDRLFEFFELFLLKLTRKLFIQCNLGIFVHLNYFFINIVFHFGSSCDSFLLTFS